MTEDPVLNVGEKVDRDYTIVHSDGTDEPSGPATAIARGGAGVVYRAIYKDTQHRAIKFLAAGALATEPHQQTQDFLKTFRRERVFLSRLSHGHIVRYYDSGVHPNKTAADHHCEYIITEYIDSRHDFRTELSNPETDGADCYRLIGEILRALRYMHSVGIGHSDVKYENIRCRTAGGERQAVLLDLGVAHQFGDLVISAAENRLIYEDLLNLHETGTPEDVLMSAQLVTEPQFITTDRIAHAEILGRYRDRPVSRADLNKIFPYHDLHAVGVLFKELLGNHHIKGKLRKFLLGNGMSALEQVVERLTRSPDDRHYHKMDHLYDDWEKLRRGYLAPAGVPELGLAGEFKFSLATPAGRAVITPRMGNIINHKLFQRLRDVPRLELLNLRYTGATHMRQEHSILVLRNVRYYLAHLLNGPIFRLMTNKEDLEAALIFAVLRDVGHYQLSHFFEDYAVEQKLQPAAGMWRHIDYDIPTSNVLFPYVYDWTHEGKLRGAYGDAIKKACQESCHSLSIEMPKTLAETVEEHFGRRVRDKVLQLHRAAFTIGTVESSPAHRILGAILNSEIDADKISYLLEDAAQTGVRFGQGIDIDGLLGALRAPAPDDLENATGPILGITQKGLAAVESVVSSRNEMYERVYWHHSTRAMAAMVKYCITRLLKASTESLPNEAPSRRRTDFSVPDFLSQTIFVGQNESLRYIWSKYEEIRDPESTNPISALLEGERGIYKVILEQPPDGLSRCGAEQLAEMEDDLTAYLADTIRDVTIRPGDVLIDVPIAERGMRGPRQETIYVYDGSDYSRGQPLGQLQGTTISEILGTHGSRGRRCRVFMSPKVLASGAQDMLKSEVGDWFNRRRLT